MSTVFQLMVSADGAVGLTYEHCVFQLVVSADGAVGLTYEHCVSAGGQC